MTHKLRNIRSLAIVAHVDHGKTTLVDALFRQGGMFRDGQEVAERLMDSNDQERERGITILAKATSVHFGDLTLQIVDTPGHADFGGEVERSLRMVDGVLLLVDAAEGPLPQTRFVLRKALELNLPSVVAINKIDRSDARVEQVLDEIYSLYIELGANDKQIEFPVLYTNARLGTATHDMAVLGTDLRPLVETLAKTIDAPPDLSEEPFSMQVNQLGHDDYVGRLVVGRILGGCVKPNQRVRVGRSSGEYVGRITGVFNFLGIKRVSLQRAEAGDIVALSGLEDVAIGNTLSDPEGVLVLPEIHIDEPTVAMTFHVNDGPFAGRDGGVYLTGRQLGDRLQREVYANVSIQLEKTNTPDTFRVLGRGELQLAVLIENLRREKYELCVGNPQVVTRQGPGGREEPVERFVIDVPAEHLGALMELVGSRKARLIAQHQEGGRVRLEYSAPTRGLLGLRSHALTITRGTAIMHSVVDGWMPWAGDMTRRQTGALVADRIGTATPYALFHLLPRGVLCIPNGVDVYEGMIIGEHSRSNDLNVNVCREKKMTNIRAAGKDENVILPPHRGMSLEQCLEWIREDEMVEVTPKSVRLRKTKLSAHLRPIRSMRKDETD